MGKNSQGNRLRDRRPRKVGVGYFPCALYRYREQARPWADRSQGVGTEDDILKGQHGDPTYNSCGFECEASSTTGSRVSPEKDSTGQDVNFSNQ